jgi:chemotaxis protein CheC
LVIDKLFNTNQIGLMEEALNIGAGNSITALSQILQCDTDMSLPVLKGYLNPLTPETFQSIDENTLTVEMNIVGELQGGLIVVISDTDGLKLTKMIRQAREEQHADEVPDISILTETANIMAGSFLTAIHDFCGLNVFHTVPLASVHHSNDLFKLIPKYGDSSDDVIIVTNEFSINQLNIQAYLLVVLSPESTKAFVKAIENVKAV